MRVPARGTRETLGWVKLQMNFRNAAVGAGGLFCAAGLTVAIAGGAQAAPNTNGATTGAATATVAKSVPGNNGTFKLHEYGTPDAFVNNDPKVCKFNFEYYFQDSEQPGYDVTIVPQGGNGGPDSLTLSMPAAGADGYSYSMYINIDPNGETDGYTLAPGHYKATVMGKNGVSKDEKAKSKVFWVKCDTTPPSSSSTPPPSSSTPPPSSSTPPPSSSTPPPTTSSSTPPPTTSTSTPPATSSTTPPPATSTSSTPPPAATTTPPASGPVVVTDGPSGGSGGNNALLGGGLAAVGVALAGAGLLRRRMSD